MEAVFEADLLADIVETEEKTAKGKKEMPVIMILEKEVEGISNMLTKLRTHKDDETSNKGQKEILQQQIAEEVKKIVLTRFKAHQMERSFKLVGEKGGNITVSMKDAYGQINEAQAKRLAAKYDAKIVQKETTYKFDNAMLKKYATQVMAAIKAIQLDEDDLAKKKSLITATAVYSVASGAIERFNEFKTDDFIFDLQPQISFL